MPRPLWLLLLAACAGVPDGAVGLRPARDPLRIEVLDEWFVRADGDRLPRWELLYRARRDCRAWKAQDLAPPEVFLRWAEDAVSPETVDELVTQLGLAGMNKITLGF